MRIAVLQFPGTNCEFETASVIKAAGMVPEVFRWNRSAGELSTFDGFVIPGGFSYQDRIRAGAVAAKKTICSSLVDAAAE
ncbi:phosphoribosylformylglycinamidine synthase subunit PurQ, partial [bacterium]|nr:phosphoribosylformylglycinamidine synthase subunit PurQ [bacterium]